VPLPDVAVDRRADDPLARSSASSRRPACARWSAPESAGPARDDAPVLRRVRAQAAGLDDFASFAAGDQPHALVTSPLHVGFAWRDTRIAFVTEAELYAGAVRRGPRDTGRRSNVDAMVRDLSEVRVGDPVVHEQHGIGRYLGLTHLDLGDGPSEFLELVYANDAKLYVPVSSLHLISRYSGASPESAPLHELGSGSGRRRSAAPRRRRTTRPRSSSTSTRSARRAPATRSRSRPHDYDAFAEGFGFEETPDQQAAIEAVLNDLKSGKPMDRLVCGDVGFGKTEVALRAAFVALADGKQVAVLVPTTLLAEQHFQVFSDRFSDSPVRIAELSRFRTPKENQGGARRSRRGSHRPRDRHAPADPARRALQEPRPGHHRRGAPLRRAAEGEAQAAARRGRRADADGDADPAHARDVARGDPRLLGDRDRAAAPARDPHRRHALLVGHRARGGAARA
jgi:transcription-repair coupling factor (superfamily II helicase)